MTDMTFVVNLNQKISIAIDGTAASGKSTLAKMLAEALEISYLDTGKLYRAVALQFLQEGYLRCQEWNEALAQELLASTDLKLAPEPGQECRVLLQGEDVTERLGETQVERATPYAARLPYVREWLLDCQRQFAQASSVVLAGRDIGTVVLPEATLKVFMSADLKERARRRISQRSENESTQGLEQEISALKRRDTQDSERDIAPMVASADALHLDSSSRDPDELMQAVLTELATRVPAK